MGSEAIVEKLIGVFPLRIVDGTVAPHDCPECLELRGQLTGTDWLDVPFEFVRTIPTYCRCCRQRPIWPSYPRGYARASSRPMAKLLLCSL
jgi:hypothetical protein